MRFNHSTLCFAMIAVVSLGLSGCAASVRTQGQTQYRSETFNRSTLAAGGLAILPVSAGQGQEGYRRPFGDAINRAVDSLSAGVSVSRWQDAMQQVNDAGLTQAYQTAISAYQTTSIVDRSVMQQISAATGKRYFLYTVLGPFEADSRVQRSALGSSTYTQESAGVTAFAQVWDAQTGDVAWEGRASSSATSNEFTTLRNATPEAYSALVARELASELFQTN